jgi:hypothetical protein
MAAGTVHRVSFDVSGYDTFTYVGVDVLDAGVDGGVDAGMEADRCGPTITARYRMSGDAGELEFAETFRLAPGDALVGSRRTAFERIARLLWLAAGLSYYKTAAPQAVLVPVLSEAEREWLEALYREGLGEFAAVNDIDLSQRPVFATYVSGAVGAGEAPGPVGGLELARRSLVAVGGGKDSCVSLEVLRQAGDDVVAFSVGGHRAARECVEAAGLPLAVAHRALDLRLGELNRAGALNGHVPVTAVVSLVAVAQAIVSGADEVVFSNERSADAPSFWAHGLPVNHQYSKGLAAERRLRAALAGATPEITYYSLLRPLSELRIASVFARLDRYLPVFTSCNAAFRLDEGRRVERWCGHCPKCRFVVLALAPFLRRERVAAIIGADLLDDEAQLTGYRELLGLTGFKPFECVGEIEESRVALVLAARQEDWREASLVGRLLAELRAAGLEPGEGDVEAVLAPSTEHELPAHAASALDGVLALTEPAVAR